MPPVLFGDEYIWDAVGILKFRYIVNLCAMGFAGCRTVGINYSGFVLQVRSPCRWPFIPVFHCENEFGSYAFAFAVLPTWNPHDDI